MSKNRPTTIGEKVLDNAYQSTLPWFDRLVLRLVRGHVNRVVATVTIRAFERSQIDSWALHEMAGSAARILWPEQNKIPHHVLRALKPEGASK